jgi:hypothetical protein
MSELTVAEKQRILSILQKHGDKIPDTRTKMVFGDGNTLFDKIQKMTQVQVSNGQLKKDLKTMTIEEVSGTFDHTLKGNFLKLRLGDHSARARSLPNNLSDVSAEDLLRSLVFT